MNKKKTTLKLTLLRINRVWKGVTRWFFICFYFECSWVDQRRKCRCGQRRTEFMCSWTLPSRFDMGWRIGFPKFPRLAQVDIIRNSSRMNTANFYEARLCCIGLAIARPFRSRFADRIVLRNDKHNTWALENDYRHNKNTTPTTTTHRLKEQNKTRLMKSQTMPNTNGNELRSKVLLWLTSQLVYAVPRNSLERTYNVTYNLHTFFFWCVSW